MYDSTAYSTAISQCWFITLIIKNNGKNSFQTIDFVAKCTVSNWIPVPAVPNCTTWNQWRVFMNEFDDPEKDTCCCDLTLLLMVSWSDKLIRTLTDLGFKRNYYFFQYSGNLLFWSIPVLKIIICRPYKHD